MEFNSILDLKENPFKDLPRSEFYMDLNINQIIENITEIWGENNAKFYYYFPADQECEDYRRAIYSDFKQDKVAEIFSNFVKGMGKKKETLLQKEAVHTKIQKAAWHLIEVGFYCDALSKLLHDMEDITFQSKGMKGFSQFLEKYVSSDAYQAMEEKVNEIRTEFQAIRLVLTYENNQLIVSQGEVEGEYENFLNQCFPDHPLEKKKILLWEMQTLLN